MTKRIIKMTKILFYSILLLSFISCSDSDRDEETPITSIWSGSHLELLDLKGSVMELSCYISDGSVEDDPNTSENESYIPFVRERFNSLGQLIYYNTTSFDSTSEPIVQSRIDDGFIVPMAIYNYMYDSESRLVSVEMYDVGKYGLVDALEYPIVYDIVYGDHELYVPVPFSVGGLPIFLLRGVESIVADEPTLGTSYSLICDGEVAQESSAGGGWMDPPKTATYTFENNYPSKVTTSTTLNNQLLSSVVEVYRWSDRGSLRSVERELSSGDLEMAIVTEEINYTDLLKPLAHIWQLDGVQDASFNYRYTDGLPVKGAYLKSADFPTLGEYAPIPFTWEYKDFDQEGNWIEKIEPKEVGEGSLDVDSKSKWIREFIYF